MSVVCEPTARPTSEIVRSTRRRSGRRRRRVVAVLAVLVVGLALADVLLGDYTVTVADFVRILRGTVIPGATFIVMEDKLPRAVVAVLAGAAFGVSGTIFQTMLRNPLASPDVIGISAGASTAAVLAIVTGASGLVVPGAALVGSMAVALVIHVLARGGGASGFRLVLVGVGIAVVMQAVTSYLLTRSDIRTAAAAFVWLNGSLSGSTWPRIGYLLVAVVVLLPLVAVWSRRLSALELGDDVASGLGVRADPSRLGLMVLAVALSAVATATVGPVAFVAFLSGPIARRLLGGAVSLLTAALTGAVIVLGAEFVAANLVPGTALPVGVVTGALGAPFLIWLLVAGGRVGRGG